MLYVIKYKTHTAATPPTFVKTKCLLINTLYQILILQSYALCICMVISAVLGCPNSGRTLVVHHSGDEIQYILR